MKRILIGGVENYLWDRKDLSLIYSLSDVEYTSEYRGVTAVKVNDSGDGITLKYHDDSEIELDYSEAADMLVALLMYAKSTNLMGDIGITPFEEPETIKLYKKERE